MLDLSTISVATFAAHVGEPFVIRVGEQAVEARLAEASPLGGEPLSSGRVPFSLVFRAGAGLPQGIFALEHDRLGSFELFLVPRQPDAGGGRYEAVFS